MKLTYKQTTPIHREARTPFGSYWIRQALDGVCLVQFANGDHRDCGSLEEAERINQEHFDAAWLACGVGAWQPIETAPDDGRFLLGHFEGGECVWIVSAEITSGAAYCDFTDELINSVRPAQATHWQPLPSPPASVETTEVEKGGGA